MFNNRKKMLAVSNILYSILLVVLFGVIYILIDGGSLNNFIEKLVPKFKEISLIGIYLVYSTTQITSMAINHLSVDVEDEKIEERQLDENGKIIIDENGKVLKNQLPNRIQTLKAENAKINNNPDMQPKKVGEFVKEYNENKFLEKQAIANQNAIRKLEAKLYKKQIKLSKEKIEAKITVLKKIKKRNWMQNFRLALQENKLKNAEKVSLLEKRLEKYRKGKLNATVKRFKPITRKSFYTISLQKTKDMEDLKLKVDFKRKTVTRNFFIAIITNAFTSLGLIVALESLFDYNFAEKWYALVSILGLYIIAMICKYLFTYIKGRPRYKEELEEALTNINSLATQCLNYCKKDNSDLKPVNAL